MGLFALAFAVACGNTGKNGNTNQAGGGATAGSESAGSGGTPASSGSESTAGTAGSQSGGTESGGSAGSDSSSGGDAGGAGPELPRESVELVRDKVPNKLDLLMMIDNSISMQDKQHLLADAMQHLVDRLVQPRCLDELGSPTGRQASPAGVCPVGSHPEFLPFNDIHAAVITSSLGSHGATGAKDVCVQADDDDHAQLLGAIRPGLPSWNQTGFLVWDPKQQLNPVGIADPAVFATDMGKVVNAAGDHGCGYEASLEAWYRFLIDPEPPETVTLTGSTTSVTAISQAVLAQRKAFLRPDSVLGIVMLSDENDCSIVDEGYGWLISRVDPMYRSTAACKTNPNDPCCQSCSEQTRAPGCEPFANDTECIKGSPLGTGPETPEDDLNLRCYRQKQRFGFELLYPAQRYIDGLTSAQVHRRSDNALVTNPIYQAQDGKPPRSPEQVLLLGIVGVPWQDVADAASLKGDGLKLLSEDGPLSAERWDLIFGNPHASPPVEPLDPFMYEASVDRTTLPIVQQNPVVPTEKLVASSSTDPLANKINGHEQAITVNNDLQYACTFALPTPITCDQAAFDRSDGCDCFKEDLSFNRPLCQPEGGGAPDIMQRFGKAYPGLRELEVLKGIGGHGIVASACPKSADLGSTTYGYRPAMDALAGRVAKQIGRSCLTRDAHADANGRSACQVVVASSTPSCNCPAEQGLQKPSADAAGPVLEQLAAVGYCGPGMACDAICLCELKQLDGADLQACQGADTPPDAPGFCYLNAVPGEVHAGDPDLARDCVGAAPRRIRFTGGAPAESSIALLYCAE